ncbi:actin cytoskeleton-regulatory complex protein pan1 [Brachypodium distachyon]|uniref:actin cytoskeleton-regulatory complex protein pan1 n=1 Tax=Brachypodium distachyon TaxID=15368 RepID=UPI00052FE158|nr:actin cytoskeleton-regulatory complex protein pan1 [Brachypodium distachyon]|eukprot:XP_003570975.2 actin cytoskeleton-regulatory complex protein pan1 [Brachypodium distachyon]
MRLAAARAMASAVATSMPMPASSPAAAVSYGWLGPRLSFGRDSKEPSECKAAADQVSKEFIDFEFSLGGSATMLPADELFADGKLLPLRPQSSAAAEPAAEIHAATTTAPELVKTTPLRPSSSSMAEAFDPYVFSPKAPTCSSRWRELLRLRKVQTPPPPHKPSPSPVPATPSRASNSSAARSLKLLLLQRNSGGRASDLSSAAAPLLRDSSDSEASLSLASSRFSLSSSSSSSAHDHDDFPRHSLDSVDVTPKPRIRLVRSSQPTPHRHPPPPPHSSAPPRAVHSPARRRPATTPPPPSVASVDSPRMNSSGKIVFQGGLERSSSSPAGSVHRSRSRVMDRSYSTPVVLNVPVCARPSFGFFKDKKDSAAGKEAAARLRSSLGRKTTAAGGSSSVSCRDLGTGSKCN